MKTISKTKPTLEMRMTQRINTTSTMKNEEDINNIDNPQNREMEKATYIKTTPK